MIAIASIGSIQEAAQGRPLNERDPKDTTPAAERRDDIHISEEAREAAEAAKLAAQARQDELRAERVEQARQRIESGAYKLQSTVLQVAARIAQHL